MAESPHLGLPFLEAGQAQKHVTHNEALRVLDALVQLSVKGISAAPPGSPEEGERHIVAGSASGTFASKDDKVAVYEDGAWRFLTPRAGWRAWSEDDEALLLWNGTEWSALETGGGGGGFDPDDVDHIYLNEAVPGDADVKFAMRGKAALLHAVPAAESGNGDVQLQISKEASADTASVFFSTNFSGRAEFGLAGSDNFKLKVSGDGSSWTEAFDIDKSTGRVRLPAALALTDADQAVAKRHVRELLTANRDYYVRTDGSNSNSGLANTSGGAFLTLQKAIDVVAALDISIYNVTIHVADGTYTAGCIVTGPWLGNGTVSITGNTTTPGNCIVSTTSSDCFKVQRGGRLTINGFEVRTTTAGNGVYAAELGNISLGANMRTGACAGKAIFADNGAMLSLSTSLTIAGSAQSILEADDARVVAIGVTLTVSGSPSWSLAFAIANNGGLVNVYGASTTGGSPTGTRYLIVNGGIISGGSLNTKLPGNANGSTGTTSGGGFQ